MRLLLLQAAINFAMRGGVVHSLCIIQGSSFFRQRLDNFSTGAVEKSVEKPLSAVTSS